MDRQASQMVLKQTAPRVFAAAKAMSIVTVPTPHCSLRRAMGHTSGMDSLDYLDLSASINLD